MPTTTVTSVAAVGPAYQVVHSVPLDVAHVGTIRLTNRDQGAAITIRLAIVPNAYVAPAAPDNADFIESLDVVIEPGGIIENIGMGMAAGEKVVAFSSANTLTTRVDAAIKKATDVVVSKLAIPAGAWTLVHTVAAGKNQAANIRTVNRHAATSIAINLAITPPGYAGPAPANADYVEPPNLAIEGGGLVEQCGKVMKAGEAVWVYSNIATLTVRVAALQE